MNWDDGKDDDCWEDYQEDILDPGSTYLDCPNPTWIDRLLEKNRSQSEAAEDEEE